jgi:hypothetical protein
MVATIAFSERDIVRFSPTSRSVTGTSSVECENAPFSINHVVAPRLFSTDNRTGKGAADSK